MEIPDQERLEFITDVSIALSSETPDEFLKQRSTFGVGVVIITSADLFDSILSGDVADDVEKRTFMVLEVLTDVMSSTKDWYDKSPYIPIMWSLGLVGCVERLAFSDVLFDSDLIFSRSCNFLNIAYKRTMAGLTSFLKCWFPRILQRKGCATEIVTMLGRICSHINISDLFSSATPGILYQLEWLKGKTRLETLALERLRYLIPNIYDMILR